MSREKGVKMESRYSGLNREVIQLRKDVEAFSIRLQQLRADLVASDSQFEADLCGLRAALAAAYNPQPTD
jgi:hypothetical protein